MFVAEVKYLGRHIGWIVVVYMNILTTTVI